MNTSQLFPIIVGLLVLTGGVQTRSAESSASKEKPFPLDCRERKWRVDRVEPAVTVFGKRNLTWEDESTEFNLANTPVQFFSDFGGTNVSKPLQVFLGVFGDYPDLAKVDFDRDFKFYDKDGSEITPWSTTTPKNIPPKAIGNAREEVRVKFVLATADSASVGGRRATGGYTSEQVFLSFRGSERMQLSKLIAHDERVAEQERKRQVNEGGKTPDEVAAVQAAAEKGDKDAQFTLAGMYAIGNGVKKDSEEAARQYEMAANAGHAEAAYNVGVIYEYGLGVPTDRAKAIEWYRAAAKRGHTEAKRKLETLEAK